MVNHTEWNFWFFSNSFSILFHSIYIIIIICKSVSITYLWISLILKDRIVWLIIKDHFHADSCISPWTQSSLNYKDLDENLTLFWKQSSSPKLIKEILRCWEKHVSGSDSLWKPSINVICFFPEQTKFYFFPLQYLTIFIFLW